MQPLRVIEICAGIGGIALGFKMVGGFEHVAFVERDDYACKILEKHWPQVPQFRDVRSVSAWNLPPCDVLAGGIPCQPHSLAGKRGAGSDERDLWPEFFRLIREIGPRYAVVENVPGLRSSDRGLFFGRILADLASVGYDAEWISLSAGELGAPHERERVWIVAYPTSVQFQREPCAGSDCARHPGTRVIPGKETLLADTDRSEWRTITEGRHVNDRDDAGRQEAPGRSSTRGTDGRAANVANAERRGVRPQQPPAERGGAALCNAPGAGLPIRANDPLGGYGTEPQSERSDRRAAQPRLGISADGISSELDGLNAWGDGWEDGTPRTARGGVNRVARLTCLGNAVVPQCAAVIGAYIWQHYQEIQT